MLPIVLSDLDDLDLGEISQGLQICGVAQLVEAVTHDTNRLIFAHGPRTPQVGEASDELGHLPCARDNQKVDIVERSIMLQKNFSSW